MFLIDKYRPHVLEDFMFHQEIAGLLQYISRDKSIPHVIFYGPHGSGKGTMIRFFLEQIYDEGVNDVKRSEYQVTGSSNSPSIISIMQSDYHIVVEPNKTNYDKYVLQEVIKTYAKNKPFDFFETPVNYKTVLINNVDNLSYHAQTSLRRTMEIYADSCRFIMVCHNLSKILDPLKSRCCIFKIPSPTKKQVFSTLLKISLLENINVKPKSLIEIVNSCDRNIKKAIWMLEMYRHKIKASISLDDVLDEIIDLILATDGENLIQQKLLIREKIYNIMITSLSGTIIIKLILDRLLRKLDDENLKIKIIHMASDGEYQLIHGRREIMHFDYLIDRILSELHERDKKLKTESKVNSVLSPTKKNIPKQKTMSANK